MQQLLFDIRQIIAQARERAVRSVNHELVVAYWNIGRVIVEEEQNGKERADYGKYLISQLAKQLSQEYGSGFSTTNLWLMRQFYQTFPILHSLSGELTWTHYKLLVRIDDAHKRDFFIAESVKNAWSVRQLERQINSLLYERLLMSQDKDSVMAVAKGEAVPTDPRQLIKDTVVRYSLPENNQQILASKYQLHLPTEQQLAAELRKELARWEQENPNPNTASHHS